MAAVAERTSVTPSPKGRSLRAKCRGRLHGIDLSDLPLLNTRPSAGFDFLASVDQRNPLSMKTTGTFWTLCARSDSTGLGKNRSSLCKGTIGAISDSRRRLFMTTFLADRLIALWRAVRAVFVSRLKVASHECVQPFLIRIPAPATATVERDIVKRVEVESLQLPVALFIPAVFDLSMPEMKEPAANSADTTPHGLGVRTRPGQIVLRRSLIHQRSADTVV